MKITFVEYIDGDCCNLYSFGDTHIGSEDCDEQLLLADIDKIKHDPYARVILNGDILQFDLKGSVGDVYNQKYPPSVQEELAEKWFAPIADKIIGVLDGNHDGHRTQEDNRPLKRIARHLDVPYLEDEGYFKIQVGHRRNGKPYVYGVYAIHGWASGRSIGSKANNLERLSSIVLADVYIVNHTHQQMAFPEGICVPDFRNGKIDFHEMRFVNAGSWQKRGRYPKRKGFRPQVLGTPTITLDGKSKGVVVSI